MKKVLAVLAAMAASGYEYGCVGLRIWLHRVTNMAASGYRYYCVS